ncbi:error-prone DNA polymerase [Nevskia sp.]|uniref:error-prone DNA polymerase n=1 Tax=Nevskia sp. TaxID=1929292 RepID=UPI0025FE0E57|nr:error-prone DNA polymerase [Nevskia sp.]
MPEGRNPVDETPAAERGRQLARLVAPLPAAAQRELSIGPAIDYAELHCLSHYSFLRGASSPAQLIEAAQAQGYTALAITDECSMAGAVQAHVAAKARGFKLIIGAEFRLDDGLRFVLLAPDHAAYSQICRLITVGRRAAEKGDYFLTRADLIQLDRTLALWLPPDDDAQAEGEGRFIATIFGDRAWIAVELHRNGDDRARLNRLQSLGRHLNLRCTAAGDVHMHVREARALQDTVTAIRHGLALEDCGARLFPNGERHLRPIAELRSLYPDALLAEAAAIAARCTFTMAGLNYEYPHELVPAGETRASWLRVLTEQGVRERWPEGESAAVRKTIEMELELITELKYEAFFLTVHDIVRWARARTPEILCQGRGSAANSAVCYALGITSVNPAEQRLLFGRFLSRERNEPPDIDVDFEHQRREEVMQYIYAKYGRERAALAATVIRYRRKSAIRDVGKALGIGPDEIDRLANSLAWWDEPDSLPTRLREQGFDPDAPVVARWLMLVKALIGTPRHLSQHVGGFVISEHPLHELVPVENAAMPDRTIIQWEKDDLEALGLLKVDCLALGMLSAIRRMFAFIERQTGSAPTIASIPRDDPETFAMIQRGETVGVFQIESRAQMSMLPRLKPANFYDLVIQIAIVRPGPIQGGMVHPYLKRRSGLEPVIYPSEALEQVLGRTLGVPLFQEQVIEIANVAAGFTQGEADQLRRSMAAWGKDGSLLPMRQRLLDGMTVKGYERAFAEQIFEMIKGFGSYGFPESHSASFALLAYVSSWIKCHHPAAFFAALVNSQPMGFYAPAQLIREARRSGVEVRPVDVVNSDWDCSVVRDRNGRPAIRLGLRLVSGLSEEIARRIVAARRQRPFADVEDLVARAGIETRERRLLAKADALRRLAGHRHDANWQVQGLDDLPPMLAGHAATDPDVTLRAPEEAEDVLADYQSTGLTLRRHPLALLRPKLAQLGVRTSADMAALAHGQGVRVAGLVLNRQRPQTAKGVLFMTLEDETGCHNLIVWKRAFDAQRATVLGSRMLIVVGELQKVDGVTHIVAKRFRDASDWIAGLPVSSRNFH